MNRDPIVVTTIERKVLDLIEKVLEKPDCWGSFSRGDIWKEGGKNHLPDRSNLSNVLQCLKKKGILKCNGTGNSDWELTGTFKAKKAISFEEFVENEVSEDLSGKDRQVLEIVAELQALEGHATTSEVKEHFGDGHSAYLSRLVNKKGALRRVEKGKYKLLFGEPEEQKPPQLKEMNGRQSEALSLDLIQSNIEGLLDEIEEEISKVGGKKGQIKQEIERLEEIYNQLQDENSQLSQVIIEAVDHPDPEQGILQAISEKESELEEIEKSLNRLEKKKKKAKEVRELI